MVDGGSDFVNANGKERSSGNLVRIGVFTFLFIYSSECDIATFASTLIWLSFGTMPCLWERIDQTVELESLT